MLVSCGKHPTPSWRVLPAVIRSKVYEPSSDTFFFLDFIEASIEDILDRACDGCLVSLELGCGTGTITSFLSSLIAARRRCDTSPPPATDPVSPSSTRQRRVYLLPFATDISPHATAATSTVARGSEVLRCDLASPFIPASCGGVQARGAAVVGGFDLVLFNFPYVPSDPEEVDTDPIEDPLPRTYAGGPEGACVAVRAIPHIAAVLRRPHGCGRAAEQCVCLRSGGAPACSAGGVALLLGMAVNERGGLFAAAAAAGLTIEAAARRKVCDEHLVIWRLQWPQPVAAGASPSDAG
eukprot:TRINITY_DN58549_c0_g1_i1.p1 TRINITY_DN58549_c0_g1~~TRINITY_DN58549_c0_g1_i1.p1  ORF type:complete len:295 (+),score=33.89 TRINITY_DN58549_c0_g1_i1:54-938(+)